MLATLDDYIIKAKNLIASSSPSNAKNWLTVTNIKGVNIQDMYDALVINYPKTNFEVWRHGNVIHIVSLHYKDANT